ncbi:MAG TPA: hypothetical protein VFT66_23260 [Roseiflexaceae bacterium]|jgi:hypothetical protein|nr:hypothetical protein [Roseiflexaceae bacterium]
MSFSAILETDTHERLRLLLPDGTFGGNALSSLLTALHALCDAASDSRLQAEIQTWAMMIEHAIDESVCVFMQPLLKAWYSGFWDFTEDDYTIYWYYNPDNSLAEEAFKQTLRMLDQRWGDVDALLLATNKLLNSLNNVQPNETWWYHPIWSVWDLRALSQSLALAQARRATRVRIQFT